MMGDYADDVSQRDEDLMAENPDFVKAESLRLSGKGDYDIDDDGKIIPDAEMQKYWASSMPDQPDAAFRKILISYGVRDQNQLDNMGIAGRTLAQAARECVDLIKAQQASLLKDLLQYQESMGSRGNPYWVVPVSKIEELLKEFEA
jgi:hypothetical protein